MITIYCIYWGDKYPDSYPRNLQHMVAKNYRLEHRFVCISQHVFSETPGQIHLETINPPCNYPGWWQKIGLFRPGFATGPSMFLDLDVIICGNLTPLIERYKREKLAMIRDWSSGGLATVCMLWNPCDLTDRIWHKFKPEYMKQVHGDQDYVHHVLTGQPLRTIPGRSHVKDKPIDGVTIIEPGHVLSYKRHCRGKAPAEDASIVAFHGKPDWHEVNDKWIGRALL